MDRHHTLAALADICRRSPYAAFSVIGYLCADEPLENLQEALEYAQEIAREWGAPAPHLVILAERYGTQNLPE